MQLIQLMSDFCAERGLPVPSAVMSSTETTMIQLQALAQATLRALRQYEWQRQKSRIPWVSIAQENQGTPTSLFGASYRKIVPGTVWNDTLRRPIFGPVGDSSWQLLKDVPSSGPTYQYRIEGNLFLVNPTLPAGNNCSTIIWTSNGCVGVDSTLRERFLLDTDSPLFPDEVFLAELTWRWLRQKEQAWTSAYEEARGLIAANVNKDSSMPTLSLDTPSSALSPGIWIPAGNWNV